MVYTNIFSSLFLFTKSTAHAVGPHLPIYPAYIQHGGCGTSRGIVGGCLGAELVDKKRMVIFMSLNCYRPLHVAPCLEQNTQAIKLSCVRFKVKRELNTLSKFQAKRGNVHTAASDTRVAPSLSLSLYMCWFTSPFFIYQIYSACIGASSSHLPSSHTVW